MPLNFDDVGQIFEEAWDQYPDDLNYAVTEARKVIGERALAEIHPSGMSPELKEMIGRVNCLVSRLLYFKRPGIQKNLIDRAHEFIELIRIARDAASYVTTHWETLPEEEMKSYHSQSFFAGLAISLTVDMHDAQGALEQNGYVSLGPGLADELYDLGVSFPYLMLGDTQAYAGEVVIQQAIEYLATHANQAVAALNAAGDPDAGPKES